MSKTAPRVEARQASVAPPDDWLQELVQTRTFVFVGGVHRSGTSLVSREIAQHPAISGFRDTGFPEDEGQYLQDALPKNRRAGVFGLHRDSYFDEHHPLCTASTGYRLFRQWSEYWDLSKEFLVEKTPQNILKSRFLQGLFPRARFVMVLRHPVAVAYATMMKRWAVKQSLAGYFQNAFNCYDVLAEDLPYLRACHILRYEDLVRRPQETMDEVFRFIGVPPGPVSGNTRLDFNEQYLMMWDQNWWGALARYRATRKWTYASKSRLIRRFEDRAQRYGYSLVEPRGLGPTPLLGSHFAV